MLPGKGARRARTAGKPGQMAGKVPVIMQMEALECGAACLAMIAAYYGKWVPLEQVRADCGVSRDGSKASNVVRAARAYGFEASGFRMQPEALRSQGVFPCIVHWNFSHFVVCRGFKGGKVHLNDPARGEVTVTEEEFDAAFTGVMLRFVPGPDFQPSGKPRSVWEFVGPRLQGSRAALAFVAITAAVTAVVGIINPALSQVFMDRLLGGKNPEWLYPFIALLIAVGAVRIVVEVLNAMYLLRLEGKMAVVSNSSFMWKVLHLPMEFFSQRMAGDLSARAATNTTIAASLVKQLAPLLLNFVLLVLYAVVMVAYSPLLAAIGIASVVINLGMARLISAKRVNVTRVQMRDAGKLAAATVFRHRNGGDHQGRRRGGRLFRALGRLPGRFQHATGPLRALGAATGAGAPAGHAGDQHRRAHDGRVLGAARPVHRGHDPGVPRLPVAVHGSRFHVDVRHADAAGDAHRHWSASRTSCAIRMIRRSPRLRSTAPHRARSSRAPCIWRA